MHPRRPEPRLIKVDVNKTSKIWDLLTEMGCFSLNGAGGQSSPTPTPAPTPSGEKAALVAEDGPAQEGGAMDVDPALLPIVPLSGSATPAPSSVGPPATAGPSTPFSSVGGKSLPPSSVPPPPPAPATPAPPPPPLETPPPLPP